MYPDLSLFEVFFGKVMRRSCSSRTTPLGADISLSGRWSGTAGAFTMNKLAGATPPGVIQLEFCASCMSGANDGAKYSGLASLSTVEVKQEQLITGNRIPPRVHILTTEEKYVISKPTPGTINQVSVLDLTPSRTGSYDLEVRNADVTRTS